MEPHKSQQRRILILLALFGSIMLFIISMAAQQAIQRNIYNQREATVRSIYLTNTVVFILEPLIITASSWTPTPPSTITPTPEPF
jgi:hypothetical protein